jgi:N-acetylneuraminic acid mutarotase
MKKLVFILALIVFSQVLTSQNFTWVKGSNTAGASSNYGTQNVPALTNTPGQRHGCAKWVDASGNLWFFGGEAPTGNWWNDLWKYNPTTNEWTWIRGSNTPNAIAVFGTQGVSSPSNEPGAREFPAYWTDNAGNFWMFGGKGYDTNPTPTIVGKLADLWKYNPTTNEWTWMKGPNSINQQGNYGTISISNSTNYPGSRSESGYSTDALGNLWLFGGVGYVNLNVQGRLNDLWKYDVTSNDWTWMSGNNAYNPAGVYGTLSVPSVTNHPGGREYPICWLDASGEIYLFGGEGRDSSVVSPATSWLNDLWKYNPTNNTWAWINGSQVVNAQANYGTIGVSAPSNVPGGRRASAHWTDAANNTWIFGGYGIVNTQIGQYLNDLFKYNPTTNEWTWMKGSNTINQNGTYGTLGVSAPSNMPGAREYSIFWTGANHKFWLFGGEGYDISNTSADHMNDLWTYTTPCNPDTITASPTNVVCSGANLTLTAVNGGPSTLWYDSPVSTTTISGGDIFSLPTLTASGTSTVFTYYAEANSCTTAPRPSITITVNPLPTLIATAEKTTICTQETSILNVTGAASYTWNVNPAVVGSTLLSTYVNHQPIITYTVTGTDLNNCSNSATITVKYSQCGGLKETNYGFNLVLLYPNPSKGEFAIKTDESLDGAKLIIYNALGEKVYSQFLNSADSNIKVDLIKGVYFYVISDKENRQANGKLIIE